MIKHKIFVNLPNNTYPIYLGNEIFADKKILQQHILGKQVMLVTNDTLATLYLPKLENALLDYEWSKIILPDGEKFKTFHYWEKILNQLAQNKHHRDTTLITLGGGVVGDMGGFAAACYQRGIPFIQIPTSLLAQVDASIGGKTAINHPVGKNLVGAFYQPQAVIIDVDLLATLSKRDLKAGMAEIVKAALIADSHFFEWLEKEYSAILTLDQDSLIKAIARACEIKRDIVVKDEKEKNVRALLNLGHTFAHAIEYLLGYGHWLHGEAVAVGLVMAANLSKQQQLIQDTEVNRIVTLLKNIGLPTTLPKNITLSAMIEAMQMDKKVQKEQLRFVLLESIGSACLVNTISQQDLVAIPRDLKTLSK